MAELDLRVEAIMQKITEAERMLNESIACGIHPCGAAAPAYQAATAPFRG